mmetsp:Transcript_32139/g.51936  ORF Transcript_32139/g.51936 Transcript_32139/m.51936 type:complete len:512 (-) Transcript_32139:1445-2980(-)
MPSQELPDQSLVGPLLGRLQVEVVSALVPERDGGMSPFVRLKFSDQTQSTIIYKEGGQPVWNERCEFPVSERDSNKYIVDVEVWDSKHKELIGFVGIGFERMAREHRDVDMWFPLRDLKEQRLAGKVHCLLMFSWLDTQHVPESVGPDPTDTRALLTELKRATAWGEGSDNAMASRSNTALSSAGVYLKKKSTGKNAKGVEHMDEKPNTAFPFDDHHTTETPSVSALVGGLSRKPPRSPTSPINDPSSSSSSLPGAPDGISPHHHLNNPNPETPPPAATFRVPSPDVVSNRLERTGSSEHGHPRLDRTASGHGPIVPRSQRVPSPSAISSKSPIPFDLPPPFIASAHLPRTSSRARTPLGPDPVMPLRMPSPSEYLTSSIHSEPRPRPQSANPKTNNNNNTTTTESFAGPFVSSNNIRPSESMEKISPVNHPIAGRAKTPIPSSGPDGKPPLPTPVSTDSFSSSPSTRPPSAGRKGKSPFSERKNSIFSLLPTRRKSRDNSSTSDAAVGQT